MSIFIDDHPELNEGHSKTRYDQQIKAEKKKAELYEPELPFNAPPARDTTAQRFDQFNKAHPEILEMLYQDALNELPTKRISARKLVENKRGKIGGLEINNDLIPFYADAIEAKSVRLYGLFEHRGRSLKRMKKVPVRAGERR